MRVLRLAPGQGCTDQHSEKAMLASVTAIGRLYVDSTQGLRRLYGENRMTLRTNIIRILERCRDLATFRDTKSRSGLYPVRYFAIHE